MTRLNISLTRSLALSLALHAAIFSYFILMQKLAARVRSEPPPIAVSLLPPRERAPSAPAGRAPTEAAKTPANIARKDAAKAHQQALLPRAEKAQESPRRPAAEKSSAVERSRDEAVNGMPVPTAPVPPRDLPVEKSVVSERRLPTVKELLPPLTYSSGDNRTPVSLNTRDPVYVSYFNRIKQAIEINWEYPELAKRYGLQGKLSVEFTVGADGQLEQLRMVRSSGSQLLDDEALRAIKAAAPFPRIPAWLKGSSLPISASMEYSDSRLNYR